MRREVRLTLDAFGMSGPEDNMEMILQIKHEVKRLCDKRIIASKITMFENELEKFRNMVIIVNCGDNLLICLICIWWNNFYYLFKNFYNSKSLEELYLRIK